MQVIEYLEKMGVEYDVKEHRPTFTAQEMAAEEHEPGMRVAKPVVVRADQKYYMCVLPAVYKIDLTEAVGQQAEVIIPARTLTELGRMIGDDDESVDITINPNKSQALFRLSKTELVSQLVQ